MGLRTPATPSATPWRLDHEKMGRGGPGADQSSCPVPGASRQQQFYVHKCGRTSVFNLSEPRTCVLAQCKAPMQGDLQNGPKPFCASLYKPESRLTAVPKTRLHLCLLGQQRVEEVMCGLSRPRC